MEKITWLEEYLEEAQRLAIDESHEPALKLLNRLLYDEPGYARLHNVIGEIYLYYADDVKLAEVHFRTAITFSPDFADSYSNLGQLLRQEERLEEAIAVLKSGLAAKQSDKSGLLAKMGQAYELQKKFSKAIRYYKDALSHSVELWHCLVLEKSIKRCKRKQKQ